MAVAAADAIGQLRDELDRLAADPDIEPADRVAQLRDLRSDLAFLTGTCDRYIADQELLREGSALDRVREYLGAREDADARGVLLDRGMATPEQLDAAGLLSHDELDRRVQDGTVEEAIVGVAHLFDAGKHPRGRGGKFATTGGHPVEKGRKGQTLHIAGQATSGGHPGRGEPARPDVVPGPHPGKGLDRGDKPNAQLYRGRQLAGQEHPFESVERPLRLGGIRSPAVRAELGSAVDTREKHSIPASPGTTGGKTVYSKEQEAKHRQWIEELYADGGRGDNIPAEPMPEGERQQVFVSGGPASGKSSADEYMPDVGTPQGKAAAAKRDDIPESRKKLAGSVEIDQDWFKKKIDEFVHLAAQHDPYASDAAHREAADVAHQARVEAMKRGYNVVTQGTGNSGPGQFAQKIVEAKKAGYRTHAFGVSAPTDVAMERAQGRAAATGRAVPEEGLRAMHANVSRRWKDVEAIAPKYLDSLQLFDLREDSRKGGKVHQMQHLDPNTRELVADNPELLQEFRDKESENQGELIRDPSYV